MTDQPSPDSESGAPTYWNGERCKCTRLVVELPAHDPAIDPPLAWWRDLPVGSRRKAVLVEYYAMRHLLDDEDGSGWRKVTEGRGGPSYSHSSLPWRAERVF